MSFIDITDLPKPLAEAAAKGNMFEVFNMIYSNYSRPTPEEDGDPLENKPNEDTIAIRKVPVRFTTIEMMDGTPLVFKTYPRSLEAFPDHEFELETGSTPDMIYLAQIMKSDKITGNKAVNYAMETAAALGAHWLTIWDAATIYCDEAKNSTGKVVNAYAKKYEELMVSSMPLSIYRAIISDDANVNNSWYTAVAKRKGFKPNRTKYNTYNFKKNLSAVANLKLSELRSVAETYITAIQEDLIGSVAYLEFVSSNGEMIARKVELDTDRSVRDRLVKYFKAIIEVIDNQPNAKLIQNSPRTLKEFLKDEKTTCYEKGLILHLFAGYSSGIDIPTILFDNDGREIARVPLIQETLFLHTIGGHPIINLSRRGGTRRGGTRRGGTRRGGTRRRARRTLRRSN